MTWCSPVWLNLLQSGVEIYSCVSNTHYSLEIIRKNPMLAGMALIEMANANEYSCRHVQPHQSRHSPCGWPNAPRARQMNLGGWQPRWVDFHGSKGQAGEFTLNAHADTVRRIVREYIGGASMGRIAKGLSVTKVPTLRGGKWGQGTVGQPLQTAKCLVGHIDDQRGAAGTLLSCGHYRCPIPASPAPSWPRTYPQGRQSKKRLHRQPIPQSVPVRQVRRDGNVIVAPTTIAGAKGCTLATPTALSGFAALEQDFFMLFLQEHPAVLLGKQTVKSNGTVATLKGRIRDLDKAIEDAASLIGKLPIKAVEAKLTALVKEREGAGRELEASNLKMMSATAAPTALESIKRTLAAFAKLGADYAGTKQEADLVKAIEELKRQLADNETRKKLLNLLPTSGIASGDRH